VTDAPKPTSEPRHGRRVLIAWAVLAVVATPLVVVFFGRVVGPGNHSEQAAGQVYDNQWILAVITPVVALLLVFFGYTLAAFGSRDARPADGPPLRGHATIQFLWVFVTTVAVLVLAGFGTYELLQTGAGGGQGPDPVAVPSGSKLQVQVIGQQWEFTYRYPSFGGLETPHLVLPANTLVELHVTSLDAVHSFWAYELGVKADANPGVDNIAYVKVKKTRTFQIRCAELCGLWHGAMSGKGEVLNSLGFASWIRVQQAHQPAPNTLPPHSKTYYPDPNERAG
jgi:cytochrome c oxidase subunit 2